MTNESLLIWAAIFACAFAVLVTVVERRKHPPASPALIFTGIGGVYLGLFGTVEHMRWVEVVAYAVLAGNAAVQFRLAWRSRHEGEDD